MNLASALLIAALLIVLTITSYVDRLYSEMGKFLSLEFQENIDVWEQRVEPRLGMSRDHIALSAAILMLLSLAFLTLIYVACAPANFSFSLLRPEMTGSPSTSSATSR